MTGVPDERLAAARATITGLLRRHSVPGLSVAVTDAERLLYAEGFGAADLRSGRGATERTAYLWFSMSKIATATVALRLADEGVLDLDRPIADLVPGFTSPSGPTPRVRQLLDHTSGLGNPLPLRWVLPAAAGDDEARTATRRILQKHGRARRPAGPPARYSNLGYLLLAEVIGRVTGEPFEDVVRRRLLEPAGMTH